MFGGRGDRPVDHLLEPCGVVELTAQLLQQPHGGRGHDHPTPAACGAVQHRPHQAQAGPLAGQPADRLDPPASLATRRRAIEFLARIRYEAPPAP